MLEKEERTKKERKDIVISENRGFEGVWIPKKLYITNKFNLRTKFFVVEIKSLSKKGYCYASDKHFSEFLGVGDRMVQTMIKQLKDDGYLTTEYEYEKGTRAIKKRFLILTQKFLDEFYNEKETKISHEKKFNIPPEINFGAPHEINFDTGGEKNCGDKYTSDYKYNNLSNTNNSLSGERASEGVPPQPKKQSRKKEANELFERIWKLYPKKLGKGQVSDTQKLKILEIGYDELSRAIQRCCAYNKDKDRQYWQNGSTFFNSGYIDFLDENYEDSSSFSSAEMNELKKEPLSERERIRLGIERARETFGEEYGESYWSGMDDGEIEIMLEYLGIRINEF